MKAFTKLTALTGMFIILVSFNSCKESQPEKRFVSLKKEHTGLDFANRLTENDSINIIDNEFVYNGAGVALGDLNGDGLDDIFFAGNQVANRLFTNKGNLKFKDTSPESKIQKTDSLQWSSGVALVDINADGRLDIYVCNTFRKIDSRRKNLLYINQGNNDSGVPVFKELAESYGLDDDTYSSHAQFFDFDQDGDLDIFIGVNRIEGVDPSQFRPLEDDGSSQSKDRLYENTFNDSLQRQVFVDISDKAGIRYHGYSHSTIINDFNDDGWPDIYVANDFLSNDLLYINNQDGTFTNRARDMFKHFSLSSMGSDIADIDNNGSLELYTTEMQPYYNKRKKLFQGPSSYQKEIFTKKYDYEKQYTRNTLQTSHGINPETGLPIFGEIAMHSNVKETDWSWTPLFADYDNDGLQDLFITNGFPKDVTDRDFGDFRSTASKLVSKEKLIEAIPEIKIPNFMFQNKGNLEFSDVTDAWGLNFPTYSSGAAYGDLDQDGDLDLVVNNINGDALLLENRSNRKKDKTNYSRIKLVGDSTNIGAIGSTIELFSDDMHQIKKLLSGRGYLSQPESVLHFGLGSHRKIDSVVITWPDTKKQVVNNPKPNELIKIRYSPNRSTQSTLSKNDLLPLFKRVEEKYNLNHESLDHDFIDFNFQRTIPHKFSQYGPSLAVGDVNGDGLDDLFVAASRNFEQKWFIQQKEGTFLQQEVAYKKSEKLEEEDAGTLLFDADNDGDLDLYIARGCAQYPENHEYYQDILLLNDGKGNFLQNESALPKLTANGSAVKAADYDRDGDLDLFIGSRVLPFTYPLADRSYILRNESTTSEVKFIDATKEVAKELEKPGLISDALWTDFNGDFWPDLIIAGEWMPLRFFENKKGKLVEVTKETGVFEHQGWWNSLAAADLDNDGDMDYIAGNVGENINYKASKDEPVRVYAKDLDNNGTIDPLISYYLRDSIGVKKEYLYHPWQDVTKQYVGIRKKFNSFGEFGAATLTEMFSDGLLEDATVHTLNYMNTTWIENMGDGTFKLHALPVASQLAPVYGLLPYDFNNDGFLDIFMVGNDYGMEVQQGPADAMVGILLENTGNKKFRTVPLEDSHFLVPGDGKSLVRLNNVNGENLIIASQNNDSLRVFEPQQESSTKRILPNEIKAVVDLGENQQRIMEFYWGSSFQSQSSRTITLPNKFVKVELFDNNGKPTRVIE